MKVFILDTSYKHFVGLHHLHSIVSSNLLIKKFFSDINFFLAKYFQSIIICLLHLNFRETEKFGAIERILFYVIVFIFETSDDLIDNRKERNCVHCRVYFQEFVFCYWNSWV
jgi:hypothetical protein